jgi:hypothetical protein
MVVAVGGRGREVPADLAAVGLRADLVVRAGLAADGLRVDRVVPAGPVVLAAVGLRVALVVPAAVGLRADLVAPVAVR